VRTPDKGIGLATAVPLKRGDFVIEYTGEIITESECVERMSASVGHAGQPQHFYYLAIDAGVAIDAGATGNPSRFINHSCDPNCETQKWHTRGAPVMGLFAKRDIAPGTELTFDYRWESIGDTQLPCRCGAKKCRGLLGSNKRLTNVAEERQRARLAAERARDASKREADQQATSASSTRTTRRASFSRSAASCCWPAPSDARVAAPRSTSRTPSRTTCAAAPRSARRLWPAARAPRWPTRAPASTRCSPSSGASVRADRFCGATSPRASPRSR
jgi:hypothetical protein